MFEMQNFIVSISATEIPNIFTQNKNSLFAFLSIIQNKVNFSSRMCISLLINITIFRGFYLNKQYLIIQGGLNHEKFNTTNCSIKRSEK